jgi:hypothetical protein
MPVLDSDRERAQELLLPILDVFGGADGGVSFARLRHDFLPEVLSKRSKVCGPRTPDQVNADRMIEVVTLFSKLCEVMKS